MEIDFQDLLNTEISQLNALADYFGIPNEILRECGSSQISIVIGDSDFGKKYPLPDEEIASAKARFSRMCDSAPHIPEDAMASLSLACAAMAILAYGKTEMASGNSDRSQSKMELLLTVSMARGVAMGRAHISDAELRAMEVDFERRSLLSKAGLEGATVKNSQTNSLKKWALEMAKGMQDPDMDIASKLSTLIPLHLASASKRPERLIYDAIRAQRKSN